MKRLDEKKSISGAIDSLSCILYKSSNKKKQFYIVYTFVFLLLFFLVFFWNFALDRSFIWTMDGWAQHYKALVYYAEHGRRFLSSLFLEHRFVIPQWDFSLGEGNDILQTLHYYVIGDPFAVPSLLFPTKYMWLYYGFAIMLRLYFTGIAFSHLCFYLNDNAGRIAVMVGTISYVFCFWNILNANRHPFFLNPLLYFPLIVLGIEKIINKEKPYVFIIAVFLAAISNFYFFYMMVLLTIVYTVVRLIVLYGKDFRGEFLLIIRIGLFAFVAVLMASVILLPICYTFLTDSRFGINNPIRLIYSFEYYASIPAILFSEKTRHWLYLGFSAPVILANALFIKKNCKKCISLLILKIFLIISFVFMVIPAFGQIFNGFSYMNNRWCWVLALLCSYILVKMWPELLELKKKEGAFLLSFLLVCFSLCMILKPSRMISVFAGISINLAMVLVLLLRNEIENKQRIRKGFYLQSALCVLTVFSIVCISMFFYHPDSESHYIDKTINRKTINSALINNDANIISEIAKKETSDFYRYSGRGIEHNAGSIYGVSNTNYYWSNANPGVADFYNDLHITEKETLTQKREGYDDRAALLSLESVRYYAIYNDIKAGVVPYGFDLIQNSESQKFTLYRNNNCLPIGYCYSKTIGDEKWSKMSSVEKQEAMLQAIYIPGENADPDDINLSSKSVNCDIVCGKGVKQKDGQYIVTENNASITLSFEELSNCESYVALSNLHYRGLTDYDICFKLKNLSDKDLIKQGKYKLVKDKVFWSEPTKINFKVKDSSGTEKEFYYYTEDYIHYGGNHDYLVNMGYKTEPIEYVIITFPKKGIYTLDSISVLAQPMDNYEAQISALKDDTLKDVKISDNTVSGKIVLDENKILCLSIPYTEGWKAWVDGEEAELYQANIRNMALFLDPGEHNIVLRYKTPLLREGMLVSLLSITAFALTVIIDYRKRKNQKRRKTDV